MIVHVRNKHLCGCFKIIYTLEHNFFQTDSLFLFKLAVFSITVFNGLSIYHSILKDEQFILRTI